MGEWTPWRLGGMGREQKGVWLGVGGWVENLVHGYLGGMGGE